MNLMHYLKQFYHGCWYLTAAIIVIIAVLISIIRLGLPEINRFQSEIESHVGDYLGNTIVFSDIKASWDAWSPVLSLDGIRVNKGLSKDILFACSKAEIKLDLIESIKRASLYPQKLTLSGLDLTVTRKQDGKIIVTHTGTQAIQMKDTGLTQWLLEQKHLTIERLTLHWFDEQNRIPPITTYNNHITLKNQSGRIQIDGESLLNDTESNSSLHYAIDIFGNILNTDWQGEIFVKGTQLDLALLKQQFADSHLQISNEKGDFSFWSSWKNAHLQTVYGEINYPQVEITTHSNQSIIIENFKSSINIQRQTNSEWAVAMELDDMIVNEVNWESSSWNLAFNYIDLGHINLKRFQTSYLNLHHSYNIFSALAIDNSAQIHDFDIHAGIIRHLSIYFPEAGNYSRYAAAMDFDGLSMQYGSHGKIQNLTGSLSANQGKGHLTLNASNSVAMIPRLSSSELMVSSLSTDLDWTLENNTIELTMPSLHIGYAGYMVHSHGTLLFDLESGEELIDLYASISPHDLTHFIKSYPNKILPKTLSWLKKSILSGQINSLELLVRGNKKDFPYLNKEGRFQMIAEVSDVEMRYLSEWPPVKKLNGKILLNEEQMTVFVDNGTLLNGTFSDVIAQLPNIKANDRILAIEGKIDSTSTDTFTFIDESTLKNISGLNKLHILGLSGPIEYLIDLKIPLRNKNTSKKATQLNGIATFKNLSMDSQTLGIQMSNISGSLNFTRNNLTAENIQARYFDKDIQINIVENELKKAKKRTVMLSGPMDQDFLKRQFSHFFPNQTQTIHNYLDYFTGNAVWLAQLDISDKKEQKGKKLNVLSDLEGMSINLPGPLAKQANQKRDIVLKTVFDDKPQKFIDVQVGSIFASRFEYKEGENKKLENLNMIFAGSIESLESKDGINFTGQIARLNLSKWIALIRDKTPNREQKLDYSRLTVNVQINTLDFFGQSYHDVNLRLTRPDKNWLVTVNSKTIAGKITIPEHGLSVIADLEHLHIKSPEPSTTSKQTDLNPAEFPAVNAFIKQLYFDDMDLGEVHLESSRITDGISIDLISFFKEGLKIDGYGSWLNRQGDTYSEFIIDVNSKKMQLLQDTFNYKDSGIEKGETKLKINAHWPGPPMDFSLKKMAGTLEVTISQGSFTNLDPKAGRLFGLLSISSLPKRLLLDFSDLFGKGFNFDTIQGCFDFENGHAYTKNLIISSLVADITMSGRTGLVTQDYDQHVTVKPKANNTLPVAGALFGPIGIGVGAAIYFANEIFDSIPLNVDRILEEQYSITGTWNEPVIEKIPDPNEPSPSN